jgi:microcystin-dependent protein
MSVDPPEDLRPPRETPHLGLPVPGDVDPADAPTAVGDLADAIDALAASGYVGVDTGDIKMSARETPPSGWLLCDGRLVSRAVFADLFAAIGVRYGAGDGSTTFAIPDYRNAFPMGAANAGSTGERGGAASVALAVAHLPSHAHGGATGADSPDHSHYTSGGTDADWPDHAHWHWSDMTNQGNVRLWDGGGSFWTRGSAWNATAGATARHSHGFAAWSGGASARHAHAIGAEGGNAAHENRPPFAAVNFFIKV